MARFVNMVLATAFLACAMSMPVNKNIKQAQIIKYQSDNLGNGTYYFHYETSNGITREEKATMEKKSNGEDIIVVRGSYSFEGDDGVKYTVRYIADENGFRPEGEHLNAGFKPALEVIPQNEEVEIVIGQRIDPKLIGTLVGGGIG